MVDEEPSFVKFYWRSCGANFSARALKNDDEIAKGLRKVFENLTQIGTKAYQKGAALRWSVVGKQYVNLLYDVALKPNEIERAKIHFIEERD